MTKINKNFLIPYLLIFIYFQLVQSRHNLIQILTPILISFKQKPNIGEADHFFYILLLIKGSASNSKVQILSRFFVL